MSRYDVWGRHLASNYKLNRRRRAGGGAQTSAVIDRTSARDVRAKDEEGRRTTARRFRAWRDFQPYFSLPRQGAQFPSRGSLFRSAPLFVRAQRAGEYSTANINKPWQQSRNIKRTTVKAVEDLF